MKYKYEVFHFQCFSIYYFFFFILGYCYKFLCTYFGVIINYFSTSEVFKTFFDENILWWTLFDENERYLKNKYFMVFPFRLSKSIQITFLITSFGKVGEKTINGRLFPAKATRIIRSLCVNCIAKIAVSTSESRR